MSQLGGGLNRDERFLAYTTGNPANRFFISPRIVQVDQVLRTLPRPTLINTLQNSVVFGRSRTFAARVPPAAPEDRSGV